MTSLVRSTAALLIVLSLAACDGVTGPGERAQEQLLFLRFATATPRIIPNAGLTTQSTDSVDIYRVNADGTGLQNLTNHPAKYGSVSASPDGRRVVFESDRWENGSIWMNVWVMNSDGTGLKQVTSYHSRYPRWSPDGSRIAFEMVGADERLHVYVANADGSNLVKVSEPALQVAGDGSSTCGGSVLYTRIELVGWLGDGRVAFARGYCGYGYRYFIVNADGSGFTQTDIKLRQVHLSPDGSKILFSEYDGPYVRVKLANADGSGARVLSTQGTHQELPLSSFKDGGYSAWSPDGKRIMFFADSSPERPNVRQYFCSGTVLPYVVNVDGTGVRRLLDSCHGLFNGWSPSGDEVAFTLWPEAEGSPDVYAVRSDGSGAMNLTAGSAWDIDAQWIRRQ
jgi:Tol biopolymer transport system component